jgi:hypothetical protein
VWISFPISRRVRVGVPWWLIPVVIPLAACFWILSVTVDAIRWTWKRPRHRDHRHDQDTIRITVRR